MGMPTVDELIAVLRELVGEEVISFPTFDRMEELIARYDWAKASEPPPTSQGEPT